MGGNYPPTCRNKKITRSEGKKYEGGIRKTSERNRSGGQNPCCVLNSSSGYVRARGERVLRGNLKRKLKVRG